jgi:Response regulator containing a CheY-like receiver domain and an HTH DNA-binding domain
MSEAGVEVEPSVASSVGRTHDRVALIAGRGPSERIAEILEREELSFNGFDDVKALLRWSSEQSPSLIVQWVEDTASGMLGCIEPLTQRFTQTPVVVVCPSIQRWEVRAALAAGAAGVVLYDHLDSALGPCLQTVQTGQICVPRGHWRQIEPPVLSTREKQILGLVVMGYMNSQIAGQLFLAESTVKSHLSSAFGKLGVRSRNEAVNLILDPDGGLGLGILGLGGEPVASTVTAEL